MATALRNFDPPDKWVDEEGRLTEMAAGFLRQLFRYIGASQGQIPVETIGGDGVSTDAFLREDGSFAVPDYPEGANPSAQIGLTATNGTAETFMRSDAAPALSQSIAPTWTAAHNFSAGLTSTTLAATAGFGCNGQTPQTAVALGAAVGGTAGAAYTAAEQTIINTLVTRVNTLLSTLKANGIGS